MIYECKRGRGALPSRGLLMQWRGRIAKRHVQVARSSPWAGMQVVLAHLERVCRRSDSSSEKCDIARTSLVSSLVRLTPLILIKREGRSPVETLNTRHGYEGAGQALAYRVTLATQEKGNSPYYYIAYPEYIYELKLT